MREGHGVDEVLLEARLDRGLDLLDSSDDRLDLPLRRARQERDQRARPGGVAGRPDVGQVAVGDQPEDHRVERVDLAAERAGEPDLLDCVDAGVVHQQADPRVEGGLGELDRAHVVLGDQQARPAVDLGVAVVQHVGERPSVGDDPRRSLDEPPVDDPVRGDDACEVELGDRPPRSLSRRRR